MAVAGWYPDQDGALRWWDGRRWTADVQPQPPEPQPPEPQPPEPQPAQQPANAAPASTNQQPSGGGEIRVRSGRTELVADRERIAIGSKIYSLDQVDRVAYWPAVLRPNHKVYQGWTFWIGVGDAESKRLFSLESGARDKNLAEYREVWGRLVELLEATACPRLAQQAAAKVAGGGTFTFGVAGDKVIADAEGLRPGKPMAKAVPWAHIVSTRIAQGRVRVLVDPNGTGSPEEAITLGTSSWNAVVLPRLVTAFTQRS